ncbi:unnamed protein product, partial [Mesorhabditis spiculigera]
MVRVVKKLSLLLLVVGGPAVRAAEAGNDGDCKMAEAELMTWLVLASVIPLIINLTTFVLTILTILQLRKMKNITESITSSTHWLSRSAIRVGIGATAKKALLDYARTKEELKMLIPTATGDKKNQ